MTLLMVRSAAEPRVSNHEAAPSFETRAAPAPQDEAGLTLIRDHACARH